MKVAIIGSRAFEDYDKLFEAIAEVPFKITLAVSVCAKSADALAEILVEENVED